MTGGGIERVRGASGDESPDASLQRAGGGYRRGGAAQARLREATDGPFWPSHHHWQQPRPCSLWLAAATRSTT